MTPFFAVYVVGNNMRLRPTRLTLKGKSADILPSGVPNHPITKQKTRESSMKTFIHADCGAKHKDQNTVPNRQNDANDSLDIASTLLNISAIDNLFFRHNTEYFYSLTHNS